MAEPLIVDVAKDGVSLIGEYEGEIRGVAMAGVQFEMKNMVFFPDLRGNLFSVKKPSESGIELLFTKHNGQDKAILKHDGEIFAEANLRGNLYELELVADSVTPTVNLCAAEEEQCLRSVLCYECWHQIEDFHRFYCEVRKTHTRPLCYQTPLRIKQESYPADLVSEVVAEHVQDCMVVENGEIYSNKYNNPQVDVAPESLEQPSKYIEAKEDVEVVEENSPQPSKSRGKKRPRLQKNEKDAVQDYVLKHMILDCDTCSERMETFELLQRHSMMKHAKRATVVCCNSNFSDGSRFVNHIQYHLNPDLYKCDYCFLQCISRDALKKHLQVHHNEDSDNPISDGKEIELSVMRTKIVKEGPSGIQESEQESDTSENTNSSEDDDEDDDDRRQNKSKRRERFKLTEEEMAQVRAFVETNRKLECDICSERFMRFQDLQKHSNKKHHNAKTGLCCNRKFVDNYRFVAHMLYHVNPERFKCTECSRISPSWEALKNHKKRMHTSRRKYSCHDRKFHKRAKRHAKQHLETTAATPNDDDVDKRIAEHYTLRCDKCQKQYDSYQALQKHSVAEHGRRTILRCCKKKLRHRSELIDHYQYHQDPNTFKCKVCPKIWHHSAALGQHMKYKHPTEWENMNNA